MNKGELIDAVAASAGLSRADATKAVDGVLDAVTSTLAGGGAVEQRHGALTGLPLPFSSGPTLLLCV